MARLNWHLHWAHQIWWRMSTVADSTCPANLQLEHCEASWPLIERIYPDMTNVQSSWIGRKLNSSISTTRMCTRLTRLAQPSVRLEISICPDWPSMRQHSWDTRGLRMRQRRVYACWRRGQAQHEPVWRLRLGPLASRSCWSVRSSCCFWLSLWFLLTFNDCVRLSFWRAIGIQMTFARQ